MNLKSIVLSVVVGVAALTQLANMAYAAAVCPSCNGEKNCRYCGGDHKITCSACNGSGKDNVDKSKNCGACSGNKTVECTSCHTGKCKDCNGSGSR